MYNTWDYKVGDLIQVEFRNCPPETGVVTRFHPDGRGRDNRKYWEWHSIESGQTRFFHEIRAYTMGSLVYKIKRIARG
jgi:hypothetical protein